MSANFSRSILSSLYTGHSVWKWASSSINLSGHMIHDHSLAGRPFCLPSSICKSCYVRVLHIALSPSTGELDEEQGDEGILSIYNGYGRYRELMEYMRR